MKCPNCGVSMKRIPTLGSQEEYACAGCGLTKKKDALGVDPMKTEMAPLPTIDKSKQASLSKPSRKVAEDDRESKNQLDRAKKNTEVRRAVKELSGKLNDLEIQFDRRVEELQMIVVKLTKALDLHEDE